MAGKSKTGFIERAMAKVAKQIEKLIEEEGKMRMRWVKGYHRMQRAAQGLTKITRLKTKRAESFGKIVNSWMQESIGMTKARDAKRAQREAKEKELQELKLQLVKLQAEINRVTGETDEIVDQVFSLNDAVVAALESRQAYLSNHVFHRLIGDNGEMRSQITFDSKDGLRRVVVMVNHITKVQTDLANAAMLEIDKFFTRFGVETAEDRLEPEVQALYKLTREILISRQTFKVGRDLYRFLGIEIDEGIFPELYKAQMLLRRSLRSEKTNSYIRLSKRANMNDKWQALPLH